MVNGTKEGRGDVPLKVVVMSATADLESLRTFFSKATDGGKTNEAGQNAKNGPSDSEHLTNPTNTAKSTSENGDSVNVDQSDADSSYSSWSGFSSTGNDDL